MRKNDRRRYSREFKMEAVNLAKNSGKPIAEIARELDISAHELYRWVDLVTKGGESAFPGRGKRKDQDELSALRRENARLKEERDILKKSLIFFAKDVGQNTGLSKPTGENFE